MGNGRIQTDIWEDKRALITQLYKEEEWPLKQVIKMVQTREFRPREAQLRARLKKWHIRKPSRKKYTGRKRRLLHSEDHLEGHVSSECGSDSEEDSNPSHPLDGETAIAAPEVSACCLPSEQQHAWEYYPPVGDIWSPRSRPPFCTTSSSREAAEQESSLSPAINFHPEVYLPQAPPSNKHVGLGLDLEKLLFATATGNEAMHQSSWHAIDRDIQGHPLHQEGGQPRVKPSTRAFPGNNLEVGGTIVPSGLPSPTGLGNTPKSGLEPWEKRGFSTPLAQYRAGLALCREAIPQLAKQEWARLRQQLDEEYEQRMVRTPVANDEKNTHFYHVPLDPQVPVASDEELRRWLSWGNCHKI
ncbi:hypothetical protein BJY01DRAFT_254660 [Aspergillus pseudoustus]|uniref:Clr5 domain-containing protein n=1 Tax=Aspergillus pseudoustus TaxID=1810923 RepID=A0ABR4IRK9_9EURO